MSLKLSASLEDYLETIYELLSDTKLATISEVAKIRSVSKPSVLKAVGKLKEMRFVEQLAYGNLKLTSAGEKYAKRILKKHNLLKIFFQKVLNVDEKTANEDACAVEHILHKKTIKAILNYCEENKI